jgi:hypothetical protein
MEVINERKKARQAYLDSLAKQKAEVVQQNLINIQSEQPQLSKIETNPIDKQSKREKLLEEKRRAFFQNQQPQPTTSNVAADTSGPKNSLFAPSAPSVPSAPSAISQPEPSNNLFGKPIDISKVNQSSKPDPFSKDEVRLGDWKKLGYPSEFAYAKQMGLLDDKKKDAATINPAPIPAPVIPSLSFVPAPAQQGYTSYDPNAAANPNNNVNYGNNTSYPSSSSSTSNNTGYTNYNNNTAYPSGPSYSGYFAPSNQYQNESSNNNANNNNNNINNSSSPSKNGFQFSEGQDGDAKRSKQEQYAAALREQMNDQQHRVQHQRYIVLLVLYYFVYLSVLNHVQESNGRRRIEFRPTT